MRLQIFSDLHADVASPRSITVASNVDAVIVAGDTCEGTEEAFARLRGIVPMNIPIVAVLGNHEYYRSDIASELAAARKLAPLFGIHLLEKDSLALGGVRFIGATMWTDYALYGAANVPFAMRAAALGLSDHKRIAWSKHPWARFPPAAAALLHMRSRKFIAEALQVPHAGPTVVVTHHAPHPQSLHPQHQDDLLSAAYVSDLGELIERGRPELWVHGHVHANCDYTVGSTRIVCNPHGYGRENSNFDPALVIEVGE